MYKYKLNIKIMGQIYYQLAPMQTHIWHKKNLPFTKGTQWEISAEKAWTVIFVAHLIEYAFVGVSLSIGKFMGGEY